MTRFFGGGPLLAVATVASLAAVGIGVSLSSPAAAPPTPLAHSVSTLDTTTMAIARAPWCTRVPGVDVAAALGGTDATAPTLKAWKNGDRVRLGSVTDVANEYGCTWTMGERTVSAWVFAPPVTVAQAEDLITSARKVAGCTSTPGAPAFGSPSVALTCGDTVSMRGLFGDAWLVCTLSGPAVEVAATLTPLAPRWCASEALAARQPG